MLCGGAGVIFVVILVLCFKCRKQGKIVHNMNEPDIAYPQNTNENERSLALEDLDGDDEHNNSRRPSLGKGDMFENDAEKMKSSSYKQINAASVMSVRA